MTVRLSILRSGHAGEDHVSSVFDSEDNEDNDNEEDEGIEDEEDDELGRFPSLTPLECKRPVCS